MPTCIRRDLELFIPNGTHCRDNLALKLEKLNPTIDEPGETRAKEDALLVMTSFNPCQALSSSSERLIKSYQHSFKEWKSTMKGLNDTECFEIKSTTKVLLGTGNASVFEFGFNLSNPYGVPYISGSSLKGLVSAYLSKTGEDQWFKSNKNNEKSQYQVQLFGGRYNGTDYIGSVNFYDARLVPTTQNWFVNDIITTHHQKYYGGHRLPDGTENPIPIKMTALDSGLKFFLVLQGPEKDRKFIKKVLLEALSIDGVGGKTAVGYGRFEYVLGEDERNEKIKHYSNKQIKELKTKAKLGEDIDFDNAVRYALEHNEIVSELEDKYKKYCPLRLIRLKLENNENTTLGILKLDTQLKRNFKNYPEPQKSEDGKFIFDYVLKNFDLSQEDIEKHPILSKCAYSWNDVGITEDNVEDIIVDLKSRIWPPANSLKEYLEQSSLSNREEALELLEMELEELKRINNE